MGETSIQVEDLNLFKICQKENYLNVTHNPTSSKKKCDQTYLTGALWSFNSHNNYVNVSDDAISI